MATSSIDSKYPVFLPEIRELFLPDVAFEQVLEDADFKPETMDVDRSQIAKHDDSATLVSEQTGISDFSDLEISPSLPAAKDNKSAEVLPSTDVPEATGAPFIDGLKNYEEQEPDLENKMLTENDDIAYRSTKHPLVDLFYELEDVASGPILRELLERAWAHDSLATLKIIFNARSIHLGKASRPTFYRCCGWLAQHHPKSLMANLQWVIQPVIVKPNKDGSKDQEAPAEDFENPIKHRGLAHGYWKDLLNLLALSVHGELNDLCDPSKILNVKDDTRPLKRNWSQDQGKERRAKLKTERRVNAAKIVQDNAFHRLLHVTIVRLFARQLSADKSLLSGTPKDLNKLSLAAKWAPTLAGFHDNHTLAATSIAEILHPKANYDAVIAQDRELYLKHAREDYRRLTLSPLRKALELVERDITAKTYDKIKYERVPSLAMNQYSSLFASKDSERFEQYLENVVAGKATISGAVLLPSTLVHAVHAGGVSSRAARKRKLNVAVAAKQLELQSKVVDGQ